MMTHSLKYSSDISGSDGEFRRGRSFNREDLVYSLPGNVTACDIGTLTMWCRTFRAFFTRIEIPRSLFVS